MSGSRAPRGGVMSNVTPLRICRTLLLAVLGLSLLVGAAGCGGDQKTPQEEAAETLDRALQAHVDGKIDEASEGYRQVLVKDPQNKFAYYNLGLIDQRAGRPQAAEGNYRLALNSDPDYVPALYNLAILRANAGATQEAIDLYRHAIQVNPNFAPAHLNLGFLLRQTGQQAAGDAEINRALEIDPSIGQQNPAPQGTPVSRP